MTGPKILAVDDTASVLAFIRSVLEPSGYQVFVATSGEACLERLALVEPDLVLLDVMMPGLDGCATCARIKALPQGEDIPVVFLSALAGGFDKARAFSGGAADYLAKPVDPQELLARVAAHLAMGELSRRRKRDAAELEALVAERTAALEAALAEVEDLLREVSHRVENNLQLLQSIIRQQALLDPGPGALATLATRVEAMALVYEQLASSRRPGGVRMDDYLTALVLGCLSAIDRCAVRAELELQPLVLPLDLAMPLGLVVNELVANARDHAYGPEGGPIRVGLRPEGEAWVLEVADRGRGCAVRLGDPQGSGLGLSIVGALAAQVSATVEENHSAGATYRLRFRAPSVAAEGRNP